jgi:hypothetical protein
MSEQPIELQYDKSDWGEGPWQTEPDRVQWQHAGYACLITRHPSFGSLCAYVGVDRAHPLYGQEWDAEGSPIDDLEVHGGVNYSAKCRGHICHVPEPGMPDDVWWLGFECAHAFDLAPAMEARMKKLKPLSSPFLDIPKWPQMVEEMRDRLGMREHYRDLPYVKAECESLAEQLRALAPVPPAVAP